MTAFFICSRRSCKCQKFLLAEVINTTKIFSEKQTENYLSAFNATHPVQRMTNVRMPENCIFVLRRIYSPLDEFILLYIILYVYI